MVPCEHDGWLACHVKNSLGLHAQCVSWYPPEVVFGSHSLTLQRAGIIGHLFMEVLFKSYMFSGVGGRNSPKQRFEDVINSITWPSHVTRLPKNVWQVIYLPGPGPTITIVIICSSVKTSLSRRLTNGDVY